MTNDESWNIMRYDKLDDAACCLKGRDVTMILRDERLLYNVISRIMHQMSIQGLFLFYPLAKDKMKYAFTNETDLQNYISLILARRLKQWFIDQDM